MVSLAVVPVAVLDSVQSASAVPATSNPASATKFSMDSSAPYAKGSHSRVSVPVEMIVLVA